jgi:hypothetical protein
MTVGERVVVIRGPHAGQIGMIVGFRGLTHAVVSFGPQDYEEVPLLDLRSREPRQ